MPDSAITKRALASAMKSLMEKMPFSKISVGDICEHCQMNRKSFYYHFRDKYDLVNWIFYTEFVGAVHDKNYDDGWSLIEDICDYFYKNRHFYMNALEVTGQNCFHDYFQSLLQPIVSNYLWEMIDSSEDSEFFAVFFSDAFLCAIERWLLEKECMPPEKFVSLLKSSMSSVARKIVSDLEEEPHLKDQTDSKTLHKKTGLENL